MPQLVRSLVLVAAMALALGAAAAAAPEVKVVGVSVGELLEVPGSSTFCQVGVNAKILPGSVGVLCYKGTSSGNVVAKSYLVGLAASATRSQAAIYQLTAKGALSQAYRTPAAVSATAPKLVKLVQNEVVVLPGERITCNVPKAAASIVCIVIKSAKTGALRPKSYSILAEDVGVAVGQIAADGKSQKVVTQKQNP